jgi:predicted DNA-binding WGR domain protein
MAVERIILLTGQSGNLLLSLYILTIRRCTSRLCVPGGRFVRSGLFAETASLVRVRPALNEWRYYRMEIWPDLFGRALLVRQWGRIGTEGRRRLDPHPDPGAAINALADILRTKRRRGYQDRTG